MTTARKKSAAQNPSAPAERRPRSAATKLPKAQASSLPATLLPELRQLIDASCRAAALTVNMAQAQLYWRVGRRIHAEVLGAQRAAYAEEIGAALWR